jgi:predicted amidohydrolase YtcJ
VTDALFVNGKVFTGLGEDDFVTSFRVAGGVFGAVGDDLAPRDSETVVDLAGRTVLPGLLDVHTHPAVLSTLAGAVNCLPPEVVSLAQLLDRLRTHPDLGRGADVWIDGYGYDESKYPEQRHPTARDLDLVSSTQPVFVRRCDGHSAACHSRALELAGITRDTPDPPGARFERDADGEPNGVLTELGAREAVESALPALSPEDRVRNLAALGRHFAERGIVAVGDMMATTLPDPLATFRAASQRGLRQQCALYYAWAHGVPELTDDDRRGRVKIAGVKLFMDGAYSNRTAWVDEAYPDSHDHGLRLTSDEQARAAAAWARRNRVQVAIHAMGDAAIKRVVDLFGDEEPWLPDRPSIRIEHASLVSADLIARIATARMSIALVSHTIFYFAEYDSYAHNLTEAQARVAYPIHSLYTGLLHTALASDCPATAWSDADNVFVSVRAAVTRRAYNGADIGRDEATTVAQALLLYTGRARHIAPLDDVGVIDEGYEASFVVLDRDVFTVPADEIDQVRIGQTFIAGDRVHAAD